MKTNQLRPLIALFLSLIFFYACDDTSTETPPESSGILIVNEGNFGSGNGTISFYDEEMQTISNTVVQNANMGQEVGSTIQSLFAHDGVGYLMCNNSDKIEFISTETYAFLDNPITNISVPRFMAIVGDRAYVTCWGLFDANFNLPDSYIAVIDINSREVIDSLESGSGPEGILSSGNKLYIANSYETSVSVIDLTSMTSSKIEFEAAPQHLVSDGQGNIWVSLSSSWAYPAESAGIQAINESSMQKGTSVPILNVKGQLAADGSGENIYVIAVEPWDANKPNQASEVQVYNTLDRSLGTTPLISGNDFYGIGFNQATDKLYVSDSKAFSGPGQLYVYDIQGMILDDQITGVGPNSFIFQ